MAPQRRRVVSDGSNPAAAACVLARVWTTSLGAPRPRVPGGQSRPPRRFPDGFRAGVGLACGGPEGVGGSGCVMLHYPKMRGARDAPGGRCVAFEKYDGTNLHWDWDRDFGWHAFGTRRDEFNLTAEGVAAFAGKHAHLRESVDVFRATLAGGLELVLRDNPRYREFQAFKAFTEFLGPNSFAGLHKQDDPKGGASASVLLSWAGACVGVSFRGRRRVGLGSFSPVLEKMIRLRAPL